MTAKEYLSQGYRLEQRIKLAKMEIEDLEALIGSPGSPGFEEHFNATRNTEAPFVKTIYKIMEYQDELNKKLNKLIKLKEEIKQVIDAVEDNDERAVLQYRYLKNYSWARIGDLLVADERTVRRWHNKALAHVVIPDNPTII